MIDRKKYYELSAVTYSGALIIANSTDGNFPMKEHELGHNLKFSVRRIF